MPTELVTVNLTRENEKEEWGFILTGGGRDKDVRLFIEQVRSRQNYYETYPFHNFRISELLK
jgi:hypothetical protein